MKNYQRGFGVLFAIVIIAILAISGGIYYVINKKASIESTTSATTTNKISESAEKPAALVSTANITLNPKVDWQTYNYSECGVSVQYPSDWVVNKRLEMAVKNINIDRLVNGVRVDNFRVMCEKSGKYSLEDFKASPALHKLNDPYTNILIAGQPAVRYDTVGKVGTGYMGVISAGAAMPNGNFLIVTYFRDTVGENFKTPEAAKAASIPEANEFFSRINF